MCAGQAPWQQLQCMQFQRGGQGVWGSLTHGGGAAGRLLLSLGLWLRTGTPLHSPLGLQLQYKTIAIPPLPHDQEHCHPHCISWNL